jgi:hypothetical protein
MELCRILENTQPMSYLCIEDLQKGFTKCYSNLLKLSQEAKDDHDRIDAMEHYIDSHQTLWSLLIGGEDYENNRQFKNELAIAGEKRCTS